MARLQTWPGHPVDALQGQTEFRTEKYAMILRKGQEEILMQNSQNEEQVIMEELEPLQAQDARRMCWVEKRGPGYLCHIIWWTERNWGISSGGMPYSSATGLIPQNPPNSCDGCRARLSIAHDLDYKNSGLITNRHKKLHGKVADLASKAFTNSHVSNGPLVHTVRALQGVKTPLDRNPSPKNPPQVP